MARAKRYTFHLDDLVPILEQIYKADDRTTAIVGAAFVDDILEQLLRSQFKGKAEVIDDLFQSEGALGSFKVKIDMCLALGVIGPITHADLGHVKDIRNHFAHRMLMSSIEQKLKPVTFEVQQISAWCKSLKLIDMYGIKAEGLRDRYAQTCATIQCGLHYRLRTETDLRGKQLLP